MTRAAAGSLAAARAMPTTRLRLSGSSRRSTTKPAKRRPTSVRSPARIPGMTCAGSKGSSTTERKSRCFDPK
jgi:hypothetical protein